MAAAEPAAAAPSLQQVYEDVYMRFFALLPAEEVTSAERLFTHVEQAHWFYEDQCADTWPDKVPHRDIGAFANELQRRCARDTPFGTSVDSVLPSAREMSFSEAAKQWKQYRKFIPVYGAIMLSWDLSKMVLVCSWGGASWTFPRGKINQSEDGMHCAVREVDEETGYNCGHLVEESDKFEVRMGDKSLTLYVAHGVPDNFPFRTRTTKEISDIRFFPIKKLPKKHYAVRPFLQPLYRWIAKRRKKMKRKPQYWRVRKEFLQQEYTQFLEMHARERHELQAATNPMLPLADLAAQGHSNPAWFNPGNNDNGHDDGTGDPADDDDDEEDYDYEDVAGGDVDIDEDQQELERQIAAMPNARQLVSFFDGDDAADGGIIKGQNTVPAAQHISRDTSASQRNPAPRPTATTAMPAPAAAPGPVTVFATPFRVDIAQLDLFKK